MATALTSALSVLALVLAVSALVLATIANRRWAARPRLPQGSQPAPGDATRDAEPVGTGRDPGAEDAAVQVEDLRGAFDVLSVALEDLRSHVAELGAHVDEVAGLAAAAGSDPTALRHVAVVRYDAFADVGGRLSYSVAMLDDTRSGLVLTTLAGKSDVRTYVRAISGGRGDGTLTAEEQQAIDAAGRRE